jgi:hypothetical protein
MVPFENAEWSLLRCSMGKGASTGDRVLACFNPLWPNLIFAVACAGAIGRLRLSVTCLNRPSVLDAVRVPPSREAVEIDG